MNKATGRFLLFSDKETEIKKTSWKKQMYEATGGEMAQVFLAFGFEGYVFDSIVMAYLNKEIGS